MDLLFNPSLFGEKIWLYWLSKCFCYSDDLFIVTAAMLEDWWNHLI